MQIIVVLISISVVVAVVFLVSFVWAVKSGQYEDTYGPSVRMLLDGSEKKKEAAKKK